MRRIETLDGLRGYFLVFMFINHVTFTGGLFMRYLNHAQLGFVEDAQGFVFLSGLLAGMVYTRRMNRGGFSAGARALWRRAAELYGYTIGCIIVVLVLREILPGAPRIWQGWLGEIGHGGFGAHVAAAALLYQATFLDILPQYIVYMLAAPMLIWLVVRGRAAAVVTGSLVLWLAVQTGLHLPLIDAINVGLKHLSSKLFLRVPFNVLAWQALFMIAMVIGSLMALDRLDIRRYFDVRHAPIVKMMAISLLFFTALRLGFTFGLIPGDVTARFRMLENRAAFSPIFMINFVIAAYVFTWVMTAGKEVADARVRRLSQFFTWLFNLSFLRLLGRHSLQIYAWHVVLIYLVFWVDKQVGPFTQFEKTLITLFGIALLALPAVYRERRAAKTRLPGGETTRSSTAG
ncbi:OpgC family protein [Pararhizobium mangrovi]|uniref:DUF1624 domain-containing protein n=1 Tax=Pararhizobium mangrovi TaxID=2590452 RepID=A0A506U4B5_9HYPH|nr:OpgC domain-containing protein [Pararhizobium mangrovi]TPW28151.1 hypothetical protein FJU11_09815 [Pararhizobium mangrovi]